MFFWYVLRSLELKKKGALFVSQTRGTRENTHPVLKYRVPHGSPPRHGWAPDPPMEGIRSPIGLVVGSCTIHPGVLGSIPKREEPGKTGAPCVKVPGSSRVLMSGLIHTGLGLSSLIAHVLHSPPPPPANSFIIGPAVINTHFLATPRFCFLENKRNQFSLRSPSRVL